MGYGYIPGDGTGGFGAVVEPLSNGAIADVTTGDVDGDGDLEALYVFNFNIRLSPATGIVAWRHGSSIMFSFLTGGTLGKLSTGDLDGDDRDDVAASGVDEARMYRSTGSGLIGFGTGGSPVTLPVAAVDHELRDIDLDTTIDFLASNGAQLSWWHRLGSGQFTGRVNRAVGAGVGNLTFGNTDVSPFAALVVAQSTAPFAEVSYLVNTSEP